MVLTSLETKMLVAEECEGFGISLSTEISARVQQHQYFDFTRSPTRREGEIVLRSLPCPIKSGERRSRIYYSENEPSVIVWVVSFFFRMPSSTILLIACESCS